MYRSRIDIVRPAPRLSPAARRVIERLLRTAIPGLADFGLVHIVTPHSVIGIAAAHRRREHTRTLRELLRIHRLRPSDPDSTVAQVIRTRRPLLRSDICPDPEPDDHSARAGRIAELHRRLAPRSALVVPVIDGDTVLGALSLCYAHSGRRYSARDLAPARRLALQVGYAVIITTRPNGTLRLPAAVGHARQGPTLRRRVAARN